jgi:glycosyltransferase involved in cell wall biosynthesis
LKKQDVFVVIPCLNEAESIRATIREIRSIVPEAIIAVVDNGSTDKTVEVALSENVTVWNEPIKGKGYAVRHGFVRIPDSCDVVFITDGDDTHSIEPLREALRLVREHGYDLVVGKRVPDEVKDSTRSESFRFGHNIGNILLTRTFRTLFPVAISDTLSGWRLMSRGFVMSFAGGDSGFEIETELNAHAFLIKCPVAEVDVPYRGRGEESFSKLSTFKDGFRILRKNLKLFRSERPYIAFSITALPWAIVSAILLLRSLVDYFDTGLVPHFPSLVASVGSFLMAALLWVAGMILERVRMSREAFARYVYSTSFSR